jgi:antirestriction protein ArdC
MKTDNLNQTAQVDVVEEKSDLYQQVTDTIVEQLDKGVALWHMPWVNDFNPFVIPKNCTSGNGYSGVNILLLWASTISNEFTSREWATFKQYKEKNEKLKKGSKGTRIIYYDTFKKEVDGELKNVPFLKSYVVFNRTQLEGYQPPTLTTPEHNKVETLALVEQFITRTKANIETKPAGALYNRKEDVISMPPRHTFKGDELTATSNYYSTLAHELTHWTGHEHRLDREFGKRFGDKAYAFEELVAELGAAFFCAELEITNNPQESHASYLSHWLDILKEDKKAIFTAASAASKSLEYLKKLQTIHI